MSVSTVDWLVQETLDMLDAGRVGLYEFIWDLRGRFPGAPTEDLLPYAVAALAVLRQQHNARMIWLVWPSLKPVGDAESVELKPEDWNDPGEDVPYLAIVRG
jgi:hypothetical protein